MTTAGSSPPQNLYHCRFFCPPPPTHTHMPLQAQSQGADAFDICEADVPPDEWRAFSAALDHAHAQPQPPGASRLHAPPAASALASTATAAGAAAAAEAGASAASSGSMESYRGCRQSSSSPDAGALQQHGVQRRPMDQQSGHSPWWLHADARSIRLGPHGQAVVVVVGEGQQQRQQQIASQHGPPPDVTKVGINCDAMVGGDGAGANDRDDDSMDVPAPHAAVLPSPPAEPLPPLHSLSCAPPSPLLAVSCFWFRFTPGLMLSHTPLCVRAALRPHVPHRMCMPCCMLASRDYYPASFSVSVSVQ